MKKPSVFITHNIPEIAYTLLKNICNIKVFPDNEKLDVNTFRKNVINSNALLTLLSDKVDASIINAGNKLKVISNYAVGYDNIDISYATEKGIIVTNTPDVLTETTAELAWALIFAVARRIVPADSFVRNGEFSGWKPMLFLGHDIWEKTLGIIGMGRIGQTVAKMSAGFSMKILYFDNNISHLDNGTTIRKTSIDEIKEKADIISVHLPLTSKTHHLCNKDFFRGCKRNLLFINTSRGPIVDEIALTNAIKNRLIAGAGLDVYENEPKIYADLIAQKNVVLLPHIGSASYKTRSRMAERAAKNIIQALNGEKPDYTVNPEVFL